MAVRRRNTKYLPEDRQNEDLEELFVFGYASKIFRDDEKAQYIEKGKHLVPWMGDSSVLIDRHDGRGHLHDLREYDADVVRSKGIKIPEEEQRIEALCDEERYLELHQSISERQIYEEEEIKRLNAELSDNPYQALGFNYDQEYDPSQPTEEQQQGQPVTEQEDDEEEEELEQPFYPSQELNLTPGMVWPETVKHNAVIERTAKFVSQHGAQMEIMIKTKQASNEQFDFMHYDHVLNPYYKHLIKLIKSGKYKPEEKSTQNRRESKESVPDSDEDDNDHSGYLHPSLMSTAIQKPSDPVSLSAVYIPATEIHDTAYGKLMNKLAKHTTSNQEVTQTAPQQHYSGIPQDHSRVPAPHPDYGAPLPPPPIPPGMTPPPGMAPPMMPPPLPPYMTHHEPPYMPHHEQMYGPPMHPLPPPPGMEPVTLPSDQPPPPGTVPPELPPVEMQQVHLPPVDQKPAEAGPHIIPPPPDQQPVIDKMANYVAKNGTEFENTVKAKCDPRFEFLHSYHVHNAYYEHKKTLYKEELGIDTTGSMLDPKEPPKAISFSIKTKETEAPARIEKKTAFLGESSEDEGEDGEKREKSASSTQSEEELPRPVVKIEKSPERPKEQTDGADRQERIERRQAEERLKDRLAQAARERLSAASKEKQLQAERKKKAALFINFLKNANLAGSEEPAIGPCLPSAGQSPAVTPGNSRSGTPSRKHSPSRSPSHSRNRSPSPGRKQNRSRTPKKSKHRKSRSRSRSKSRRSRSKSRSRRSRSKSRRSRSHTRSRSRTRSPRRKHKRKKSKTPPSAYARTRRSRSPGRRKRRSKSRSRSPVKSKKKSSRRSRSRSIPRKKSKKSRSRSPYVISKSPIPIATSSLVSKDTTDSNGASSTYSKILESSVPVMAAGTEESLSPGGASGQTVNSDILSKVRAILKASRQDTSDV